jgi:transketolase
LESRHSQISNVNDFPDILLSAGTNISSHEDHARRFEACGWHAQSVEDGNDVEAIDLALRAARNETMRPSLILVRTHLGYGYRIRGSPQKTHDEAISFIVSADLTTARMSRDRVADDTVQSGHKVPDDVRALLKCRRKPKVSVVIAAKFRWQYRLTGRPRMIEQRSDRLHIESEPRLRTLLLSEPHAAVHKAW